MTKTFSFFLVLFLFPLLGCFSSLFTYWKRESKLCLLFARFTPFLLALCLGGLSYNLWQKERAFSYVFFDWLSYKDALTSWTIIVDFLRCAIASSALLLLSLFYALYQKRFLQIKKAAHFTLCFNLLIFLFYILIFSSHIILTLLALQSIFLLLVFLYYPLSEKTFLSQILLLIERLLYGLFHIPLSFIGKVFERSTHQINAFIRQINISFPWSFDQKQASSSHAIYKHACLMLFSITLMIGWCVYLFVRGGHL
ncbi:MAG: hypothetical protein ACTSXQ_07100 [Alphaproteobacteria bacterium]